MRDLRRDVGNTPQDCHAGLGKPGHFCTNSHVSLAQHSRGGWGLRQTYKKPSVGTDTCLQRLPGWAQRSEQETHSTYRQVFDKYMNAAINPRALLYNLSFPVATSDGRLKARPARVNQNSLPWSVTPTTARVSCLYGNSIL